jgi:hypothetical protein
VAAGTYNEHLVIEKPVHLIGDPGDGNEPGPGPNAPVLNSNFVESFPCVQVKGTGDVIVEGFEIKNSTRVVE